jgi:hypothetical protein
MPTWKGWHAFRRGNATHLAKNFSNTQGVTAASKVLRHFDEGVTQEHYIEESRQVTRVRAAAKQLETEELKKRASVILGAGVRTPGGNRVN